MSQNLIVENGKITLPEDLVGRYRIGEATLVRVIETRTGILLVPLIDAPMDQSLAEELADWQAMGTAALESLPYESDEQ